MASKSKSTSKSHSDLRLRSHSSRDNQGKDSAGKKTTTGVRKYSGRKREASALEEMSSSAAVAQAKQATLERRQKRAKSAVKKGANEIKVADLRAVWREAVRKGVPPDLIKQVQEPTDQDLQILRRNWGLLKRKGEDLTALLEDICYRWDFFYSKLGWYQGATALPSVSFIGRMVRVFLSTSFEKDTVSDRVTKNAHYGQVGRSIRQLEHNKREDQKRRKRERMGDEAFEEDQRSYAKRMWDWEMMQLEAKHLSAEGYDDLAPHDYEEDGYRRASLDSNRNRESRRH